MNILTSFFKYFFFQTKTTVNNICLMSPELAKISNAKNDLVGDFRTFDLGLIGKLPI